MATYVGSYNQSTGDHIVTKDGKVLSPEPSLAVRNHSPTGFAWGYHGSGPAQLALALLLDVTGDVRIAEHWHQRFKADRIAGRPADDGWVMTTYDVQFWLRSARQRWPVRAAREAAS